MGGRLLAVALTVLAAFIWGSSGMFVKSLGSYGFSATDICFMKSLAGTLILGVYLAISSKGDFRMPRKVWAIAIVFGIARVFADVLNVESYVRLPVGLTSILQNLCPFFTMILAFVLFRDRLTAKEGVGMALAIGGCVLFYQNQLNGDVSMLGVVIALLAAVMFACGNIGVRALSNHGLTPNECVFYMMLVATFVSLPFTDLGGIGTILTTEADALFDAAFSCVIVALLPTVLCAWALNSLDLNTVSILCILEVVFTAVLGMIFLGERYDPLCFVGLALVVLSSVAVNLPSRGNIEVSEDPPGGTKTD